MAHQPPLPDRFTLQAVSYLSAPKAFQVQSVCRCWLAILQQLDAKALVLSWRPAGWLLGAASAPCLADAIFCRALLRDLHACLASSALQVAYVTSQQHLVFVEPTAKLATPPQGGDVFPVNVDRDHYSCRIAPFSQDKVWWSCLEGEAFQWPLEGEEGGTRLRADPLHASEAVAASSPQGRAAVRACEAVPGFVGASDAFRMPEDVAAVLALNAAWYEYSFMTRKLQTILMLRDGRFALLGSSENQNSMDSHACGCTTRCLVADSLASLVALAQDDYSRRLLQTELPCKVSRSAACQDSDGRGGGITSSLDVAALDCSKSSLPLTAATKFSRQLSAVALPRSLSSGHHHLDGFVTCAAAEAADAPGHHPPLFDKSREMEPVAAVQVGDEVRVLHEGLVLQWVKCDWPDNGLAKGPVDPEHEVQLLGEARQKGLRWRHGSTVGHASGCHYAAFVQAVHRPSSAVDVLYSAEPHDGNDGFTGSLGSTRDATLPPTQETDVGFHRVALVPRSAWYKEFRAAWEPCGAFSFLCSAFEDSEGNEEEAPVAVRCFSAAAEAEEARRSADAPAAHRLGRVADAFRDTQESHSFRLQELSAHEALLLGVQQEDLSALLASSPGPGQMWPRQPAVDLGKRLFLELLRHPSYWPTWQARGGESPAHIAKLFGKTQFVRLVFA